MWGDMGRRACRAETSRARDASCRRCCSNAACSASLRPAASSLLSCSSSSACGKAPRRVREGPSSLSSASPTACDADADGGALAAGGGSADRRWNSRPEGRCSMRAPTAATGEAVGEGCLRSLRLPAAARCASSERLRRRSLPRRLVRVEVDVVDAPTAARRARVFGVSPRAAAGAGEAGPLSLTLCAHP